MAWSLGNHLAADDVAALLEKHGGGNYGPKVERQYSKEEALGIIHAAIWGHGCRAGSTAGAYAAMALFNTLGLKGWTFEQEEADALVRFRQEKAAAARALRDASPLPSPALTTEGA